MPPNGSIQIPVIGIGQQHRRIRRLQSPDYVFCRRVGGSFRKNSGENPQESQAPHRQLKSPAGLFIAVQQLPIARPELRGILQPGAFL